MSEATTDTSKRVAILAIVVAAISLCCSVFVLSTRPSTKATEAAMTQDTPDAAMTDSDRYVLYIGTNDKDTYQMELSREEAQRRVEDILLKHFGGYTVEEANGYWTDDEGLPTSEYTLVCTLDDPEVEEVYAACDEIREALNQNTILVEHTIIKMQYYAGA